MKKVIRISLVFFLVAVLFLCLGPAVLYADDGEGDEENSLNVGIGIIGDNPNVDIGIEGDNPKVNVDVQGDNSEIYLNDRNIEIPTEVHQTYTTENYTTVVQGVNKSEVKGEINEALNPINYWIGDLEGRLGLTMDGFAKMILLIGDPNQISSSIIENLNNHSDELEKQGSELERQGSELEKQGSELKKQGLELEKQGSELEKQGLELEKQGSELEKQGLELEKQGLELEKQGSELEKQGLELERMGTEIQTLQYNQMIFFYAIIGIGIIAIAGVVTSSVLFVKFIRFRKKML